MRTTLLLTALLLASPVRAAQPDVVFADFEAADYGAWKATGKAFGKGPAAGTLPNQMPVSGFKGKRLVNSYHGGDGTVGTLTSPAFKVSRKYIAFLIGGGDHRGKTCLNLVIDGKVVRTATGQNSEQCEEDGWDVSPWLGKKATLQIVDDHTGGWGHVLIDHIVFTDQRPAIQGPARRELVAGKRYLHLPVKNGARERRVTVSAGGAAVRQFTIELADGEPDWWAFLDIGAWKGKKLAIEVDRLPANSRALTSIDQRDALKGAKDLYQEALRPQLHFSTRRGWINDPNGLVYHNGTYHLFYQHNPYGTRWGNMHWGHAVSRDLVRWEERPAALYPDKLGPMFSGSAVVDGKNTSGLGKGGKPPLVLFYTAFGAPPVQCLAYSNDDGKTWTKYSGNPILKNRTPEDRDPKVIWHEPSKRWVMVLYVAAPRKEGKGRVHAIEFFTSPDLKTWTYRSRVEGLFECPDLFPLPLDGDAKKTKWILTAASSEYFVGSFDGETFKPETKKLPGHRGKGFYAAQTYSDIPAKDGRRIQIGWGQMPSPGMAFNQMMCFPCAMSLRTTREGPRLAWAPIKEIEKLRDATHQLKPFELVVGIDPAAQLVVKSELLEVRTEITPGKATQVTLTLRGVPIGYDVKKQELTVAGHKAPAPLVKGKLRLIALVDRTSVTVWAADGLTYVPMPVVPKAKARPLSLTAKGGAAEVEALAVHELRSIWAPEPMRTK